MFGFFFLKKVFVVAMTYFSCNLSNVDPLKCVSLNNQKCKNETRNNKNYQQ